MSQEKFDVDVLGGALAVLADPVQERAEGIGLSCVPSDHYPFQAKVTQPRPAQDYARLPISLPELAFLDQVLTSKPITVHG